MVVLAFNPSIAEADTGDLCEFDASLAYIVSSGPGRVYMVKLSLKIKQTNETTNNKNKKEENKAKSKWSCQASRKAFSKLEGQLCGTGLASRALGPSTTEEKKRDHGDDATGKEPASKPGNLSLVEEENCPSDLPPPPHPHVPWHVHAHTDTPTHTFQYKCSKNLIKKRRKSGREGEEENKRRKPKQAVKSKHPHCLPPSVLLVPDLSSGTLQLAKH